MRLSTKNNTITIIAFSAYHAKSVACERINDIQFEDPCADTKLSIVTLMDDVQPIVTEKFEFEYWDRSTLISIVVLFDFEKP